MKIWFKAVFALLLLTSVLSADTPAPVKPAPPTNAAPAANDAKPVEKSKFALLNIEKESLNEEDFGTIFQQDLSTLSNADVKIDNDCSNKLDLALRGAAADPNALAFIFTQATEGRLCAILSQKPAEVEAAMKNFKDTEGFTPVTNKNGAKAPVVPATPAATNAAPAAVNTTNTNNGQTVNSGNNVDPKVVAAQKAKQDEQMKAAQDAINNLFAQVGNKMNTNAQIPAMNFGGAFGGNNGAAQADLGAGLARVPVNAARN